MTSPPDSFYIFVDSVPVTARSGQSVLDAIEAWQPELSVSLREQRRSLTDSRGLPISADSPAYAGGIFRAVSVRASRTPDDSHE